MNTIMYFEIQVDDPKRAIAFYTSLFGWKFIDQPTPYIPYWRIETDSIAGGMLVRPGPAPTKESGTNAFICSIEVKHFDAMSEKILSLGGGVALPKFAVPGRCWQGYFFDTEGNIVGIFEVDPNAA